MKLPANLKLEQVVEAAEADTNTGFCMTCGTEHDGVEPDARKDQCDKCGANDVYGAEEILLILTA